MGTVGAGFSMSLDGFIAGENDDVERLFAWMFGGNTDLDMSTGDEELALKVTSDGVDRFEEVINSTGAIISGRRLFDVAGAWGGKHPMDVPIVVVTHHLETIPAQWLEAGTPFTFVTEGIEQAVAKAKEIAGDKNVGVAGANIMQQCLKLGLLDEIGVDLVPVLLGKGVRMFEYLGVEPIELECTNLIKDKGVTHMNFRVVK